MSNNFCQNNINLCNHTDPNVVAFYTQVCGIMQCSSDQSLNYPTLSVTDNTPTPMMTQSYDQSLNYPTLSVTDNTPTPMMTQSSISSAPLLAPVQTSLAPVQTSLAPVCTDNPYMRCRQSIIDFDSKPDYYNENCCDSYTKHLALISRNATQKPFKRITSSNIDFTKLTHDPNISSGDPDFCINNSLGSIDNVCNNYSDRCPNTCRDYNKQSNNNNSLLQNQQPMYDQNSWSSWN
jgi:hypothetical protein